MPSELETALSRLQGVKKIAGGYQATCPCHHDIHQSLSLKEDSSKGKKGKFLAYCHAGCSFESIVKKLDLRPDTEKDTGVTPVITDTYDYISIEGLPYQVVRYNPKAFKQRRPDGKGGWIWGLNGITPSLYLLPEVIQAIKEGKQVFIVEGEKDVDNLRRVGQVATSISGGASTKWHPSLVPLFQGARVVIIPDNDEAGRKYATYVANLLYGWCASLKLITLPSKDVSDYLDTPFTKAELSPIENIPLFIDNTGEYIPTGAVTRDDCIACKGVNQYLWQQLLKQRAYPKKPKELPF